MPYIKIETSKMLDESATRELLKKTSAFLSALLNKPEQVIMISICKGTPMIFSGDMQPSAYIELKSVGLQQDKCSELSKDICNFLEQELAIPPDRVYIEFSAINGKMFGWNCKTV